jgi:hypothetical protein
MNNKFEYVKVPEILAKEIKKIDWEKIPDSEILFIFTLGTALLKKKGYMKNEEKK